MSALFEWLATSQHDPTFRSRITAWRRLPARPPRFAAWPAALDPRLRQALALQGIPQLYTHQAQAVEQALAGHHVLMVTPTASGKTLAYHLPVLHTLLHDPEARALYLFPTKALAQDQYHALQRLVNALHADIPVAIYDGDTPQGHRKAIREQARVVFTNPDMLHTGILPHHGAWHAFFSGLQVVVIDEVHVYRGIFGSHVANVLRRLKRIAAFYQGRSRLNPEDAGREHTTAADEAWTQPRITWLLASATVANPLEHGQRLIEEPLTLVDQPGAASGEKHILFLNPPLVDRALGLRRSHLLEAQKVGVSLLAAGIQTLFFTRSRMATELLLTYLREALTRMGLTDRVVEGYRGGYLPHQRRAVEQGLRERRIHGVTATNALELGIDIGHLQAVVLVGFPGTIASAWQQMGRAGRGPEASLAILIAGPSALDQYVVRHPEYLLENPPEHALIQPDNLILLTEHVRCAAFELPFRAGESFGRFAWTSQVLEVLEEEGEVTRIDQRWYWTSPEYPASQVSLRTASPDRVLVLQKPEGRSLGEMDRETAPAWLHPGAIYLHQGRTFLVEALDWEQGQAWVKPVEVDYYTRAIGSAHARVLTVYDQVEEGLILKGRGELEIRSRITGFRRIKRWTHENLGYGEVDLPETVLETTGYWLAVAEEAVASLRAAGMWANDPNDYGPNWPEQRDKARARDGYRCVLCGAPESPGRQHDVHHIRPFRSFGYLPGVNENYRLANQLDNLRTLCRSCHQKVERGQRLRSGLGGLAYLLGHLAPLHLMCDPGDLGYLVEALAPHTQRPTLIFYDRVPGGMGLAERLYELQPILLDAALEVVRTCGCQRGCPGCVGPVSEGAEAVDWNVKRITLALLETLRGKPYSFEDIL